MRRKFNKFKITQEIRNEMPELRFLTTFRQTCNSVKNRFNDTKKRKIFTTFKVFKLIMNVLKTENLCGKK